MIRSARFIKAVHAVLFILGSVLLSALIYEVVLGRITALTWIAVFVFIGEGIILLFLGWRCPLTDMQKAWVRLPARLQTCSFRSGLPIESSSDMALYSL